MKNFVYFLGLAFIILTSCKQEDSLGSNTTQSSAVDEDEDNTKATIDDNYTYKLPIIFHVLYQDANDQTQYVPVARLQTILNQVNELYQGNVYGQSENINVKFIMANYDESGKKLATPGVEYVHYTDTYPIDPNKFMNDNTGNKVKYIWDPNEYINVMVYHFTKDKEGQTLGISHMPYIVKSDSTIDGLESTTSKYISKSNLGYAYCSSINSTYINSESTRYTLADKGLRGYDYTSTDVTVTLAHELGHYLGLFHAFAENKTDSGYVTSDDCHDSDFCKDTPSYNRVAYNSWLSQYLTSTPSSKADIYAMVSRTSCDGTKFDSEDIMDYSICFSFKFTPDQKYRMRQVLYYSPLIPGPKKNSTSSRASDSDATTHGKLDLPIRTMK